jgi:hypothetical protein
MDIKYMRDKRDIGEVVLKNTGNENYSPKYFFP